MRPRASARRSPAEVAEPASHRAFGDAHGTRDLGRVHVEAVLACRQACQKLEIEPKGQAHATEVIAGRVFEEPAFEFKLGVRCMGCHGSRDETW